MMAEIRQIRADEMEQVTALFNNAYRIGMTMAQGWTENLPPEETIAVVEKERVASFVRMNRYRVWVGGGEMGMGGIGAVSTWADLQGKGYAGKLMRESVRIMRERGDAVSALYPFSHRYYGKFGWASMGERIIYTDTRQDNLMPYEERALVRRCLGEEDIERLDTAYCTYALRFNGMVVRTRENWSRRLKHLMDEKGQAYLIENDGKPIGYFFCENVAAQPWGYECITRDFACATPEAYPAMFGFLAMLPTNVTKITITAPAFPPLIEHFKEPSFTMKWGVPLQYRVVDVERAVVARGFLPEAHGRFIIAVQDTCGDWNTGMWEIEVQDGHGEARRNPAARAELEMTIQQFAQLFMGHLDMVGLARQGLFSSVSIQTLQLVNTLFHDRPVHLIDAF
jgi:predicted acetyltransferase